MIIFLDHTVPCLHVESKIRWTNDLPTSDGPRAHRSGIAELFNRLSRLQRLSRSQLPTLVLMSTLLDPIHHET